MEHEIGNTRVISIDTHRIAAADNAVFPGRETRQLVYRMDNAFVVMVAIDVIAIAVGMWNSDSDQPNCAQMLSANSVVLMPSAPRISAV